MLYNPNFSFFDNQLNYYQNTDIPLANIDCKAEKAQLVNFMENDGNFDDYLMIDENLFDQNQFHQKQQILEQSEIPLAKQITAKYPKKVSDYRHDSNSTQYEYDAKKGTRSAEDLSQKNSISQQTNIGMNDNQIDSSKQELTPKTEVQIKIEYIQKKKEFLKKQQNDYFSEIVNYEPLKYKQIFPFQNVDRFSQNNIDFNLDMLKFLSSNQSIISKNIRKYFRNKNRISELSQVENKKIKKQKAEDFMQNSRFFKKKRKMINKYFKKKVNFLNNNNCPQQETNYHPFVKYEESNF